MSGTSTEVSETLQGIETPHVIDSVDALLAGRAHEARQCLAAAASATSWAAVAHRLEVAGRNIAGEVVSRSALADLEASALAEHVDGSVEPADVLAGWWQGHTVADIDLHAETVDLSAEQDRIWTALVVVAWAIDRAGFPPQVIA